MEMEGRYADRHNYKTTQTPNTHMAPDDFRSQRSRFRTRSAHVVETMTAKSLLKPEALLGSSHPFHHSRELPGAVDCTICSDPVGDDEVLHSFITFWPRDTASPLLVGRPSSAYKEPEPALCRRQRGDHGGLGFLNLFRTSSARGGRNVLGVSGFTQRSPGMFFLLYVCWRKSLICKTNTTPTTGVP